NPNESSTVAHENAFFRSLDIIKEEPLGRGLGTAGTIGQRFFSQSITNESWYLQLGTEMGVVSPLTYLTMTVVVAVTCFAAYRRLQDTSLRILALGVASTSVGFLVVANFLHAWENTALSMLIWLYAGMPGRAGFYLNAPIRRRNLAALARVNASVASTIDQGQYDAVLVDADRFTFAPYLLQYLRTPSVHYVHHRPRQRHEQFASPTSTVYQRARQMWHRPAERQLQRYLWQTEVALVQRA